MKHPVALTILIVSEMAFHEKAGRSQVDLSLALWNKVFSPAAAAVLTFFIAGLLFICALSTSITW